VQCNPAEIANIRMRRFTQTIKNLLTRLNAITATPSFGKNRLFAHHYSYPFFFRLSQLAYLQRNFFCICARLHVRKTLADKKHFEASQE
jgi:hypothetical protein